MTLDRISLSSISTPTSSYHCSNCRWVISLCCRAGNSFVFLFSCSCCFLCSQTNHAVSAGQLTNHGCRVILDSDSCCFKDRIIGLLVCTGPRRCDSQRLWELDRLHLPSVASASLVGSAASTSSTSFFAQWHHRLGHLCGSRLSTLICRGFLG